MRTQDEPRDAPRARGGDRGAGSGRPTAVAVTGASAGIGRATAVAFARRGCRVALLARGEEGLQAARREVEAAGGEALVLPVDVADAEAVFSAADRIAGAWGGIDVWVNNAMATVFGPVQAVTPEEYKRVTEVAYLGSVHGTLAALRHMRPRDAGTIVQVGSALAYRSIPLQSAYCGAKAAMRGFTDSLRAELIHDRSAIRLTMVQLPGVNTPQFGWWRSKFDRRHRPVGAPYQPEAAAEAVVRAAETAPRELWVGLPVLQAIVGTMVAPGLLDRYLAATSYDEQLSDQPAADGPDILFAPADRDGGTRGRFGQNALEGAWPVSAGLARGVLAATGAGLAAAAFLAGRTVGRRERGSPLELLRSSLPWER